MSLRYPNLRGGDREGRDRSDAGVAIPPETKGGKSSSFFFVFFYRSRCRQLALISVTFDTPPARVLHAVTPNPFHSSPSTDAPRARIPMPSRTRRTAPLQGGASCLQYSQAASTSTPSRKGWPREQRAKTGVPPSRSPSDCLNSPVWEQNRPLARATLVRFKSSVRARGNGRIAPLPCAEATRATDVSRQTNGKSRVPVGWACVASLP